MPEENVRAALKDAGWRQGSIIPSSFIESTDFNGLCIIVSQDCDLLSDSLEAEPVFEVLTAQGLEKKDSRLCRGKNPRKIHFEYQQRWYEAQAFNRVFLDRRVILGARPVGRLQEDDVVDIKRWLGRRYYRSALPDAFNERTRSKSKEIGARLSERGEYLTGIYLKIIGDELDADSTYDIEILGTMRVEDYQLQERREPGVQVIGDLAAIVGSLAGIELLDYSLLSEDKVSIALLRSIKRWDYDAMSLANGVPAFPIGSE